jgi:putative redox protein
MSTDWKEITANWQGDLTFVGKNPAGGSVQMGEMDGKPGVGPMELLLAGLAGCTGHDVVSILKKKKQPLKDFRVTARGKRADDYPMVYTEIEIEYVLWGEGLSPKAVEQAIQLSENKYCSASAMLAKTAEIRSTYRIIEPKEKGAI